MGALGVAVVGAPLFGDFTPMDLRPALWAMSDFGTYQESTLATPSVAGGVVGAWADRSANARHLVQAGADGLKPTLQLAIINGKPVIRGDGTNDYLSTAYSAAGIAAITMACIVQPQNTSATCGFFTWQNGLSSGTPFILFQRNVNDVRVYANDSYRFTVAHGVGTPKSYILTADGTTYNLYVNGVIQTPYAGGFTNQAGASGVYVCNGFSNYSATDVAEVLIAERVLTAAEITNLARYFTTRYGL